MIGATSFVNVTLAASFLFAIIATAATSVMSRMMNMRFMVFLRVGSHECFSLPATTAGSLWLRLPQILFIERVIEIADHHLFPGLRSPAHLFRRVGVELVIERIVEVRDDRQLAPLRRGDFFLEDISHLPVEVPARHREQNFGLTVGVDQRVFEILAADVHVRMETVDMTVFLENELRFGFVIGVAWRDRQVILRSARRDDALLNRRLGEDQTDAAAVRSGFAIRDVVNLEDQRRSLLDQFGLSGPERQRGFAGRPADQASVRIAGALSGTPASGPDLGRIDLAGLRQITMLRIAYGDNDMVHYAAIALTNFGELYVLVFGKVGRDGEIFVRDHAFRGNAVFGRHGQNHVRLAYLPAFGVIRAWRHILGIAFLRATIDPGGDRVNFLLRETRVVGEFAVSGIGEPGRHCARYDFFADRLGPGPNLLVVRK